MSRKLGDSGDLRGKRGQVTIFIIIAVAIVALAVLIFFFFPDIRSNIFGLAGASTPEAFIQDCIEEDLNENIELVALQGGSLAPRNYIQYDNSNVEYLCYTGEFYLPCVMQQPALIQHVQFELKNSIDAKVDECFNELKKVYEGRGYDVGLELGEYELEMLPERVVVRLDHTLSLRNDEGVNRYDSFDVILNNNLYELLVISTSILNWEARYGDAETTIYMTYYRSLKVEKLKQTDGSTIYVLTNRDAPDAPGNKFQFASRSFAWPPGYGVEGN